MRRVGWRMPRAAAIAFLLAGCQPGSGGPLDPVSAPGVVEETDEHVGPVAVVRAGPVTARITGSWGTERPQLLRIAYRNTGRIPVSVAVGQVAFRHEAGDLGLIQANDLTDMDVNSTDPARYTPRTLVGGNGPEIGSVRVAPGETRTLAFEFAAPRTERPLESGDLVTVHVPSAGKPIRVVFECSSGSFWPF